MALKYFLEHTYLDMKIVIMIQITELNSKPQLNPEMANEQP